MVYEEFHKIERVAERAIRAAKVFADGEDTRSLRELSWLIVELRHASLTLSDPGVSKGTREEAINRLVSLFSYT